MRGSGTLRSLTLAFLSNTKDLMRGVQEVRGATQQVNNEAQKTGGFMRGAMQTAIGFGTAALAMGGVSATFSGIQNAVIGMNSTLETSSLQFETLMGDSDKAKSHVQDLFQFAKYTPFETGPIIQASRMLQTFGGDALNSKDNLYLFGDAAAAVSTDFSSLSFWVGRMYSAIKGGQPFGEAAMRLQELAVLSPEVRREMEQLQKSGAGADEVWKVFTEDLGRFNGAMEKQATTWQGLTSTLSDAFNLMMAEAFKPLFDMGKQGMKDLIALFEDPEFVNAIMEIGESVVVVGEHVMKLVGAGFELAKMWAKHIDEVLPLLMIWFGIRYVRNMRAATDGTNLLGAAWKSLRGVMLLGLPFLIDAVEGAKNWAFEARNGASAARELAEAGGAFENQGFLWIGDANQQIKDMTNELYEARHGAVGFFEAVDQTKWRAIRDEVEGLLGELSGRFGPVFEELKTDAQEWGRDWMEVAQMAIDANENLGLSYEEWRDRVNASIEAAANPELLKTKAIDTAAAITDPIEEATDEAVEDVKSMYANIASAIAAAESELRAAGGDAVKAWLDPVVWRNQSTIIENELETAYAELVEISKTGTAAEVAQAKVRVAQLTAEAIELQQNLALTGTEMEQEAQLSALRTSEFMLAGLGSEDEEIKALFQEWDRQLRETLRDMQTGADTEGRAIPRGMARGIDDVAWQVENAVHGLGAYRPDTSWAYSSGYGLGSRFAAGMSAWVGAVKAVSIQLGDAAATGLRLRSPAKEGALSEDAAIWSNKLLDRFLMPLWSRLGDARAASLGVAGAVAAGLQDAEAVPIGVGAGRLASAPGPAGPGGGLGSGGDLHIHLSMAGGPTRPIDEQELADILQRMDWSVGRVQVRASG